MTAIQDGVERARALLDRAGTVLVLTGAGVSAESGVPTFRGDGGLWKRWRAEELATPEAFARDPRLVWEWYGWRRARVGECLPNPGHTALARRALTAREGAFVLVTQNVDGLHEAAARSTAAALGAEPDRALPLELHGSLFRSRCTACGGRRPDRDPVDASSEGALPRCRSCGGLMRPDVVWFGEMLDPALLERAFELAGRADVCLVAGTSALVHPAASLPLTTLRAGGAIVEINPEPTPLTASAAVALHGSSGALLPELLAGP